MTDTFANNTKTKNDDETILSSISHVSDPNDDAVSSSVRQFKMMNEARSSRVGGSERSAATPSLHKGMMRERKNCDPYKDYEVVKELGAGSMGSVFEIQKIKSRIGGSARRAMAKSLVVPCGGDSRCLAGVFSFFSRIDVLFGCWKRVTVYDESIHSGSDISTTSSIDIVYALKTIHLDLISDACLVEELRNEIDILKTLNHPNIVKAIETYEKKERIYIVTELCSGGDLYSRDPYTEVDAIAIIRKIVSAVAFMHRFNIIHRDLKYENILFENCQPHAEIKIIDFGLSRKYVPENPTMRDHVGTIYSMAPQVMEGHYDSQADVWSIGVISFMLLSSQMPFYGKRRDIIEDICACRYKFRGSRWKNISQAAKDFVKSLIVYDPKKRLTAREAIHHPFLEEKVHHAKRSVSLSLSLNQLMSSIERYSTYSKLKKLALMVISYKSNSGDIRALRKSFCLIDKHKDGTITPDELREALAPLAFFDTDVERLFKGMDVDRTGHVNYTEFLAATIEALGPIEEARLAEAFDRLDSDDSGFISVKNLRELFAGELPDKKLKSILAEVHVNNEHKIYYKDFLLLWDKTDQESSDGSITSTELVEDIASFTRSE